MTQFQERIRLFSLLIVLIAQGCGASSEANSTQLAKENLNQVDNSTKISNFINISSDGNEVVERARISFVQNEDSTADSKSLTSISLQNLNQKENAKQLAPRENSSIMALLSNLLKSNITVPQQASKNQEKEVVENDEKINVQNSTNAANSNSKQNDQILNLNQKIQNGNQSKTDKSAQKIASDEKSIENYNSKNNQIKNGQQNNNQTLVENVTSKTSEKEELSRMRIVENSKNQTSGENISLDNNDQKNSDEMVDFVENSKNSVNNEESAFAKNNNNNKNLAPSLESQKIGKDNKNIQNVTNDNDFIEGQDSNKNDSLYSDKNFSVNNQKQFAPQNEQKQSAKNGTLENQQQQNNVKYENFDGPQTEQKISEQNEKNSNTTMQQINKNNIIVKNNKEYKFLEAAPMDETVAAENFDEQEDSDEQSQDPKNNQKNNISENQENISQNNSTKQLSSAPKVEQLPEKPGHENKNKYENSTQTLQPEKIESEKEELSQNSTKVEFPKVQEFKAMAANKKSKKQESLACGKSRPNFLVIMTDDQGHDDIGFYNWNGILQTPNMDKLASESVQFENFYTDPLCAPTRASLLTGRHHLKTGVWGVHGGMDYINLDETLIAEALQYHGYKTAHFGKWHSGTTPGFNPWDRGFDLSYTTKLYTFYNTVVKKNGWTMNTQGWVEDWLADRIVEYLQARVEDGEPFFILWTPMSIHKGRKHDSEWYEDFLAPEWYYDHYWGKVSRDLVHVFAALEYFDSVLGKVMWNLDQKGLGDDTVVMFFGDNGPHIYQSDHEWGNQRYQRIPSQMKEQKGFIEENGIRNFLFVRGLDQFPSGQKVYENVGVIDIYPTMLELAGVSPPEWNKPLDGVSFAPLLCEEGWWEHSNRYLYFHEVLKNSLGTNEIFELDENRETDRYQNILKYWGGGQWFQGFQYSTALRHKQWKYIKTELFDIPTQNYQEYDWNKFCNSDYSKCEQLKETYKQKIDDWWWSVLADPGAFKKPTFLIGKEEWSPVRVIGAIERTAYEITIGDQTVSGFKNDGDYLICRVRVVKEGNYEVRLNFGWTGYKGAYVQIAVGQHWQLWNGEAPNVQRKIDNNGPLSFGEMYLSKSGDKDDEMMIRLVGRDWHDGSQIFWWIDTVEFVSKS